MLNWKRSRAGDYKAEGHLCWIRRAGDVWIWYARRSSDLTFLEGWAHGLGIAKDQVKDFMSGRVRAVRS